jgi:hypothetical protein
MSASTLTGTSDTEIDRRFLNPFELEAPVENRLGACITYRRLLIRLEEQLFYSPLRRALPDHYKIPWLHEPDRTGVMCRGQNSRKYSVGDRLPQKIAADIPPLKNHAVDCIPLMVGELSTACTPDILTYSHIS